MLTLLIVGNESFGNSLSNGIDLGNMTTAVYPHSDIDSGELLLEHKRKHRRFKKLYLAHAHGNSKTRSLSKSTANHEPSCSE